ncbi:MAG: type IV toxin-antitoxin system AbiEi family antitoxin domain-containing protein [Candidatus Cloacimonetes bacterium]|nr:type IV toxin-antitoxin system AbiEi family antitoxin domain-containing protein [Candidatus Cloacimonadota bacterium]
MRISLLEKLAKKNNTFTFADAFKTTKVQRDVLWVILSRLEEKGWIERIEKGKYMIIPLGAEKGKYTLHEFIIGSLLVKPYCISYWSALHYYGFTEQIPNTVFIQTTSRKKKQKLEVFGVKYKIVRVKPEKFFSLKTEWVEESSVNIVNKEKCIIDCLDKPQYCGGIVEVAKALKNKNIDIIKLLEYAQRIGNSGVIRRLGYLCDLFNKRIRLPEIKTRNYLFLDPTMNHKGTRNSKWRLTINLNQEILGNLE